MGDQLIFYGGVTVGNNGYKFLNDMITFDVKDKKWRTSKNSQFKSCEREIFFDPLHFFRNFCHGIG